MSRSIPSISMSHQLEAILTKQANQSASSMADVKTAVLNLMGQMGCDEKLKTAVAKVFDSQKLDTNFQ